MPELTRRNRELMFWSMQVLGWSALTLSQYLGTVVLLQPVELLRTIPLVSLAGFLVSSMLRYVCRYLWRYKLPIRVAGALVAAYIAALAWRLCVNLVYEALASNVLAITHWSFYFTGAITGMYLMTGWVGLYFGFRYYESLQDQQKIALRASALAQQAQLKMLRYQLNPHFLFNTLNGISTLILDNRNGIANRAVTALAEFLRYTLEQDPMKRVTLAQELDAINLYLEIEKLRFGPRLAVLYVIEEQASHALVPSLLLQPLVENSIKYAVSSREQGGTIQVEGSVQQGMLCLSVRDDGPGITDSSLLREGRGVGIRNTRERLQVLYGERSRVTVENAYPGLRVSLQFPLELAEKRTDQPAQVHTQSAVVP
jgi:two-component system, LytTR family, sensor kinase